MAHWRPGTTKVEHAMHELQRRFPEVSYEDFDSDALVKAWLAAEAGAV